LKEAADATVVRLKKTITSTLAILICSDRKLEEWSIGGMEVCDRDFFGNTPISPHLSAFNLFFLNHMIDPITLVLLLFQRLYELYELVFEFIA